MTHVFHGTDADISGVRVAIAVSTYHHNITGKLHEGAVATLREQGVADENISILMVPGAYELPLAAQSAIENLSVDAVICLGCVIRGETTHDQHINSMISNQLGRLSLDTGIPVAFGVLTCNTLEQAIARSGGAVGNKGVESAEAVLHMVRLLHETMHFVDQD